MRKMISFSMKNKLAVWLLTIVVIVSGVYAGTNMKMETMPDFTIPVVSVSTVYQGAAPSDVDENVTQPIEQRLQTMPGVQNVSSKSSTGMSSVIIEYGFDKDMDQAVNDVKEAVDQLTFPDQVKRPTIMRISMDAMPVYSASISGDGESLEKLSSQVKNDLLPAVEGVDGVSSVTLSGQQSEQVQIAFKESQLKKYGLSQDSVIQLIKGNNVSTPLGLYTIDDSQKSVVVSGNIGSANDLKKIRIPVVPQTGAAAGSQQSAAGQMGRTDSGQTLPGASGPAAQLKPPTIQLSDVADVTLVKNAESISRTNGKESIGISVVKGQDANTVDVVNGVKDQINNFEKTHEDVHATAMFDQGEPIVESVNTMIEKAIFGALFAMLVILLFLRNIRTTLISVVSIPLSLLIALALLNQMDITLNIMTLGALTIAIGRVVDDSIVVIENIYRRMTLRTEKLTGKELIREATHEMFIPIMSSTIVTIAVFMPMALVTGIVGQIFMPFALTIVFSLLASLLVAITIVPMLANSFFKKGLKKKIDSEEHPGKLAAFYRRVLNGALNHKAIVFGSAILLFAASLFLVPHIGASFLPSDQQKELILTYNPKPGQTQDDTKDVALQAEKYLNENKDMTKMQYSIGGSGSTPMFQTSDNQALFYVSYKKGTQNFDKLQKDTLKGLNGLSDQGEWKIQDMTGGGAGSNQLSLYVYGDSMNELQPVVEDVTNTVKKDKNFSEADSSLTQAYDQYTIVADQQKLGQYGIAAGQIAQSLMASGNMSNAQPLTTIKRDGDDLNVYLKVPEQAGVDNINDLTGKTVKSQTGQEVPIDELATVKSGKSPQTITKRDGKLYAEVTAKVNARDVSGATADLKKQIDKLDLPDGASVSFAGVAQQMNESFSQLGMAMLAAILIVYFVLVVTFGGGLAPFAILFSLPFAIIGSLVALLLSGETISISSLIGALMLIGIVVTNAVVLIDRVIHKEKAGFDTREALLEAAGTRIRPILMTAIATICALIPLAIGMESSGGMISKGLAITVIGGITSSTILTLIIVPIVYEALMKLKHKFSRKTAKVTE
ncbi:efflux RND transporter permease subunit [Sporolactobacillus sp. Y61]|uniref:Efflux RND transporter permease subunit n=1 Tax=Sporolactobacillus sp. Y61 TaxID=3160863 RepID=A0AAU8ICW2_9BACL|nr:efflux RND transporter permease subunit [Sporolactobacillus sp. THM19-2]RYL91495.1 efflux RND transporter permease subunit [Sporolactobacillus sp. THM19-2]